MTREEELVELDQVLCLKSLRHYTERAWKIIEPGRIFVPGWHIDAISEHLEAVFNGDIRNLIINIPPRHMKSLLVSVLFPSWGWAKKPELRWLFASYAKSLSVRDSVKCRRVIQSPWYQDRFGHKYQLTGDQNAKEKYENNQTGHRIATSVDGSGTGEGGDIICIDDPHKVNEAESDSVRDGVIDWYDGEMSSRGNDPKKVAKIIVMQRVHEKDLSGHLLAKESGWEHLCLPAEFEPERKFPRSSIGWRDPRRKRGELLWPERFGKKEVDALAKDMTEARAAGQLQQRPAPADGIIFKREWLKKHWTPGPDVEGCPPCPEGIEFFALSVDLPFDEGKKASFAVFQVWGKKGPDKFLLDQTREQCGFPVQQDMFEAMLARWPVLHAKWIEKKANGAALISTMKTKYPGLIDIHPEGSKEVRAESVTPQFRAGNIWLPPEKLAPWLPGYIEELVVFNNGTFNDQVDATTQAVSQLSKGLNYDCVPVSIVGESKWIGR